MTGRAGGETGLGLSVKAYYGLASEIVYGLGKVLVHVRDDDDRAVEVYMVQLCKFFCRYTFRILHILV